MIWEFGTDENPDWVHVSYVNEDDNRNRCLKAYREGGKTKYKVIQEEFLILLNILVQI